MTRQTLACIPVHCFKIHFPFTIDILIQKSCEVCWTHYSPRNAFASSAMFDLVGY